jgi:hypothetical protein
MKREIVEKMVKWLFREGDLSLNYSEWATLAFVTIIKADPKFSELFFDALKVKIQTSFADPRLSSTQKDIILYSALSYLAFASPHEYQTLCIKEIEYTIEKIPLTSGWFSATYYAYGLKAKHNLKAQSFLIFQGTTTPADHGFLAGIIADTRPHGAVGTHLYSRGQALIETWINKEYERTEKRVLCTGQSLGGAMSLHAHIHQPQQVDFFIINPPFLTNREKQIYVKNHTPDLDHRTLKVLSHCNDPVRELGSQYLPQGTQVGIYGNRQDPALAAHARSPDCKVGSPDVIFTPYKEKLTRNHLWKITKILLFIIACLLHVIALPIRIAIRCSQKLSVDGGLRGGMKRRTGVYTPVQEDSRTISTKQIVSTVEYSKRSIKSIPKIMEKLTKEHTKPYDTGSLEGNIKSIGSLMMPRKKSQYEDSAPYHATFSLLSSEENSEPTKTIIKSATLKI